MVKRWIWLRVVLLAAAVLPATPASIAWAQLAPTTAPNTPSAPRDVRQYLDQLLNLLRARQTTQADRDEAAMRLAVVNTPETRMAIGNALIAGDEKISLAAARAAPQSPQPDPAWVVPLSRLLGRDRILTEAAARALARFDGNPQAYGPLIEFAHSRQPAVARVPVCRELGGIVEKPVAEGLVAIVADPTEDAAVRMTAAEALEHLSGQSGLGPDAVRWSQWLRQRSTRAPADWHNQVVSEQHARLEQNDNTAREQLRQFKAAVVQVMSEQYQRLPISDRPRAMLGYLDNPESTIRQIGASFVQTAVSNGQPVPQEIHARLIELVGDASPDVRAAVAQVLSSLADPSALDALLIQLQLETSPDISVTFCRAVAKIPSNRSVPVLSRLLNDPSIRVASAAAEAIRALAPQIQPTPEARQVFSELARVLERRTGPSGQPINDASLEPLRVALVSAMALLGDRRNAVEDVNVFSGLLSPNESPGVRAAALEGLGQLGDPAATTILPELDRNTEPDATLRAAAATALGQTGSFAFAGQLDQHTLPKNEPIPMVRDRARLAFQSLLPNASPQELGDWAQIFNRRNDPASEIAVLKTLTDKLVQRGDLENLAVYRQTLGQLYLAQGQPAQAVPYLRPAYDFWLDKQSRQHTRSQTVDQLIKQIMIALLQSRQYHEAAVFAEQAIRSSQPNQANPNQEIVGPQFRDEAAKLIQNGKRGDVASYKEAAKLIKEALSMTPPLDEAYQDALRDLEGQVPGGS